MAKLDPGAFVTNKTLSEAVDTILKAMDRIIEETKAMFASQNGYMNKTFATKDDLKREIGWLKDDIKGLTADLSDTPTRKEFNKLQDRVDKYLVA